MVHIGDMRKRTPEDPMDEFSRQLLPLLDKGDILDHVFTWEAGGVIKHDGSVVPELKEGAYQVRVINLAGESNNAKRFKILKR